MSVLGKEEKIMLSRCKKDVMWSTAEPERIFARIEFDPKKKTIKYRTGHLKANQISIIWNKNSVTHIRKVRTDRSYNKADSYKNEIKRKS